MRWLAFALLLAVALGGCAGGGADDGVRDMTSTSQPTTPGSSTGASSSTSSAPVDYTVELYDSRYDPTSLAVPNYQKVVFVNNGALTHTVTIVRAGDPAGTTYRDQPVQTGGSVDFNFPNDGTYTVYCRYHGSETSGMRMTITV